MLCGHCPLCIFRLTMVLHMSLLDLDIILILRRCLTLNLQYFNVYKKEKCLKSDPLLFSLVP